MILRRSLSRTFTKLHRDILSNIHTEPMDSSKRKGMILEKAIKSFSEPSNANNISELGDLTSYYAMCRARDKMV